MASVVANLDDFDRRRINLGNLGAGIALIWKAITNGDRTMDDSRPMPGIELTGWCLAHNDNDDLIFMYTNGYTTEYLGKNSSPSGAYFLWSGISVKSRESNSRFMVLRPFGGDCDGDDMVEYARRWDGYEVTGKEKEYYMELIQAAREKVREEAEDDYAF